MNNGVECRKCHDHIEFKELKSEDFICQRCLIDVLYQDIDESYIQVEYNQQIYKVPRSLLK